MSDPRGEPPALGDAAERLVPRPKRIEESAQRLRFDPQPVRLAGNDRAESALRRVEHELARHGLRSRRSDEGQGGGAWGFVVDPSIGDGGSSDEAYRLDVAANGVVLVGASATGLFRGATTLAQWIRLHSRGASDAPRELPGLHVEDAPDLAVRGVMLDVSRDKVPTRRTLLDLVDRLADWKVNQIQLYVEHAFAYRGHEIVWRDASPLTADDVAAIQDACRERFIELVPNQNCFGHLHRWLVHEPYRRLAECPEGIEHPFSERVEPFSLCATDPGAAGLVEDLLGQLLPLHESRTVNIGCDETFDLGRCRTKAECERRGRHAVYVDWVARVAAIAARHGRRCQFWGDVILEAPEHLAALPDDATALLWGYEAGHPFAEQAAAVTSHGIDTILAPGTSSWNSLAGRTANAVANVAEAARAAAACDGVRGVLVADWGDFGHLQPLPTALPGLMAGAAAAWNVAAAPDWTHEPTPRPEAPLTALLDLHAFEDEAGVLGQATTALGDAWRVAGATPFNGSALFWLLVRPGDPPGHRRYRGMTHETLEATEAHVAESVASLPAARSRRDDSATVERELRWVANLLVLACRLGRARLDAGPAAPLEAAGRAERLDLAAQLEPLVAEHEAVWLARNRPGGRADSVRRLESLLAQLRA